ncbi:uncharacterized protein LOC143284467 [Babylonia areolata]|uniref:uncharacterized protein LOC143278196 n=1 Tax=Babylonia areolata TaxID=304850 RepID=UPI003FD2FA05
MSTKMTTLPRITPSATPTPRSISAGGGKYGPYPPPDLSSTWDHMKIPQRVNPIAPPPPKKRINSSWETVDQHWHNDKRRIIMQQREHTRYHSAWSKAFYGSPADQEAYRRHFRDVLKQQMADQDAQKKQTLKDKVKESEAAVQYDNQCRSQDLNNFVSKFNYLKQFRDDNKNFMENQWQQRRQDRQLENRYDREVLRYNPINWSGTLK